MNLHLRGLALALCLLPALFPQDVPVFHADVNMVTVPFVVTNQKGVSVRDLQPGDFRLYVDGVRQDIQNLWSEPDLPLLLGVIIDVSESQGNNVTKNEAAVNQFLERIIRPQDRAFVVAVNENVILKSEVTGGPYGLRHVVLPSRGEPLSIQCGAPEGWHGRKWSSCGGTALWNAVYTLTRRKLTRPNVSKALLILSDGNDTGSKHWLSDALEEVQRSGTTVYAVKYPDSLSGFDADGGLFRLADETGGVLFDSSNTKYSEILARIEADLRSRYIIGFRPGAIGGKSQRHLLRIEAARPELTVRTRREYFEQ
jgi:VWFA-related protein